MGSGFTVGKVSVKPVWVGTSPVQISSENLFTGLEGRERVQSQAPETLEIMFQGW